MSRDTKKAYLHHELQDKGATPLVEPFDIPTFSAAYTVALPGGNATIARRLVQKIVPDAYPNAKTLGEFLTAQLRADTLDRPNQPVRIRTSSLVVSVSHDGSPETANGVIITYAHNDKLQKVRAKAAVLAGHQHVNKKICSDLSPSYREAMEEFHHAPMLTVSVAVRNWKFLDKLGISYARWFEGFGWHMGLHRQILIDGKEWMPLDPNKPAVLSMYNPFVSHRGVLPAATQAQMARAELFAMSYDDIANGVREQFTKMFGPVGFDAERDIAGIVANKWGHAYLVPQPGFYFGRNGKPPAVDILRKRYGRLSFAHSEFHGEQLWFAAVDEAIRASKQALEVV